MSGSDFVVAVVVCVPRDILLAFNHSIPDAGQATRPSVRLEAWSLSSSLYSSDRRSQTPSLPISSRIKRVADPVHETAPTEGRQGHDFGPSFLPDK